MPSGPILLVDGSSYLFRAFFSMPDLSNSAGTPTGAILGVTNMMHKLLANYPHSPVAVVFDPKGKTFRDEIYADYKANRPPMPSELREQIQPIHDIIRAMGLPLIVKDGVEADDVIGALARMADEAGRDAIISSSDKDMAQLVNERVKIVDSMSDKVMDATGVREKFAVEPTQIVDLLALMGDSSDNIPGVPGVGAKTAAKWLGIYGSVENLLANADEIKGKVGEKLRASLEVLAMSRDLARIRTELDPGIRLDDLMPGPPNLEVLRTLYARFEFRTLLARLDVGSGTEGGREQSTPSAPQGSPQDTRDTQDTTYELLLTEEALDAWIERLREAGEFALDTETTSTMPMQAKLAGISFACEPGRAAYVPFGHITLSSPAQLPRKLVLSRLRPLLEDARCVKIGQHIKYDALVLRREGIHLGGLVHDTQLESFVLNSSATRHNMDDMAKHYLDRRTRSYKDVTGRGKKQIGFHEVELDQAADYAAEDADVTLQLHRHLTPKLYATPSLAKLYESIELPLGAVLARMEYVGAFIDGDLLQAHSREMGTSIDSLRERIYQQAGEVFNPDSPKQLQQILFERRGLRVVRKTPTGQPSTDESVLEELADEDELPRLILEYRSLAKLKSTYTDKLPEQINPHTGRVHTSYHQCVASTGRLASSDPNLQNIPIRTPEGRRIRQAFTAPPGRCLVAADYSQIELRIMAHLSRDENLIDYFRRDLDVHSMTASDVFRTPVDAVDSEQRRVAKMINFGLMYGMSAFGLAKRLGIARTMAADYMERYFARFTGVQAFMQDIKEQARRDGYVETLLGRRVYLNHIRSSHQARRAGSERLAINAPMQGSAADIIKKAMIDIDAWLREGTVDAQMILQVHDELIFEVADADADVLIAGITERMESALELIVPLPVGVGRGPNWDEAH